MVKPYLPDIIENCVSRVDASFSLRAADPFNVFFNKGIIQQVRKSVYKADQNFPLVWFVFKYNEGFGKMGINSLASFEIIIAMPTDPEYTQQERDDISFKPRLIPIKDQLIKEFHREKWFVTVGDNSITHSVTMLPFWGQGDVESPNVNNLFKNKFIDAISIVVTGLKIKRKNCSAGEGYPVADTSVYPISAKSLVFFDDIELIVDGGESYDPVAGESSVIIPELIGKDYEVSQRVFGQLRRRRNVEIIPDTVNGGFALTGGFTFTNGDTYFIKIRPLYIP